MLILAGFCMLYKGVGHTSSETISEEREGFFAGEILQGEIHPKSN